VSTRTIDRVPDESGEVTEVPGGPGTYAVAALEDLGASHRLITGERAMVEVVRCGGDVEYVIPPLPSIPMPSRLDAHAVILSPIMREIDVATLPPFDGLLAVDLQGFVRDPSRPSRHVSHLFDLTPLFQRSHIVKASSEEMALLTQDSRAALAGRLVLETQGVRGALLHQNGTTRRVSAIPVAVPNAIGAGDTYLAAFVLAMMQGQSPLDSGERAARFTEDWLRRTKIHGTSG
jgi:hypothetical protein